MPFKPAFILAGSVMVTGIPLFVPMKYYLLSICLLPIAYWFGGIFVEILLPETDLPLPKWLLQAGTLYFAVGAVVLLVDLWRSKRVSDDDRLWWTVVLLFFGFILAPLYWFMVVNKHKQPEESGLRKLG